LVVDDEPNARTALAELLRDEGYDVETAAHALDAVGKLTRYEPDVVIVDLHMPGMEGLDLVSRLCRASDAPAVIAVTAFRDPGPAVAALRAGACDYVTKPVRFDELLVVLAKVIRHRDVEQELEALRRQQRETEERRVAR
jgi:two-component system response regulator HydG